jgi:hypothetical protein
MVNTSEPRIYYSKAMPEIPELIKARRCLAQAEAAWVSADGLVLLGEGLALLEELMEGGSRTDARTARNLAASYAARIYERIGNAVAADRRLPEPELEHFFKVVLRFDQVSAVLPPAAAELKIAVVRQLIERYYEGHPPERKQRALEQLAQLRGSG